MQDEKQFLSEAITLLEQSNGNGDDCSQELLALCNKRYSALYLPPVWVCVDCKTPVPENSTTETPCPVCKEETPCMNANDPDNIGGTW